MWRTWKIWLTLFLISQTNCALMKRKKIAIADIELCAVAGSVSNGADCTTTNSKKSREINLSELIRYLEPDINPDKPPAIIMKAEGWTRIKSALEEACIALRGLCEAEFMDELKRVDGNVQGLLSRAKEKALKDH